MLPAQYVGKVKRFAKIVATVAFVCICCTGSTAFSFEAQRSAPFTFGVDAESFANPPSDFTLWMTDPGESKSFREVLQTFGKPAFRFATIQRWDWRGKTQTDRLISSDLNSLMLKQQGYNLSVKQRAYNYVSFKTYYDFCKKYSIESIPMLDVRFFYDATTDKVVDTASSIDAACSQIVYPYVKAVKENGNKILFWEIGNEEYLPAYQFPPKKYAFIVKAFLKSIKAADPDAKVGIQLYLSDLQSDWFNWSTQVLQELYDVRNQIDYASLHYYSMQYFEPKANAKIGDILVRYGFSKTKIAVTEWRHNSYANEEDQSPDFAPILTDYLLKLYLSDNVEIACVHAFPFFGGLAEWSNGKQWTSYAVNVAGRRKSDTTGIPHWRILPFGAIASEVLPLLKKNPTVRVVSGGNYESYNFFDGTTYLGSVLINRSWQPMAIPIQGAQGAARLDAVSLATGNSAKYVPHGDNVYMFPLKHEYSANKASFTTAPKSVLVIKPVR